MKINPCEPLTPVRLWRLQALLFFALVVHANSSARAAQPGPGKIDLESHSREQIRILHEAKLSRTPAQKKVNSQLLYLLRQRRQGTVASGLNALQPSLRLESDGRVLVDLRANVSPELLQLINSNGGIVVNSVQQYGAIRALINPELVDVLSARGDVRRIQPAARATTSGAIAYESGDIAHRAAEARQSFFADGTGVKIGVLSDSIDGLTNAQASGALPAVTILPGQAGSGTGEGTAMLEIVHALAPGSPLYFATAFNSEASFAQNIRALRTAGCKIIIDDVTYFDESPFQDGIIAQAVNDVSASGTLYFSSAGNSAGADRGNSGTWEGDFKDVGFAPIGQGGHLHDFGGSTFNTVLPGVGFERLDLSWTDPLGHSTNDYDVYVLNSAGSIVRSSEDNQDGTGDPYESVDFINVGERIVILKFAGDDRFLHLSTGRGKLAIGTSGATYGHNASGASNAFCVAAARVGTPPAPFTGGTANPVELFSSDGPRHVFFKPDGSPLTPGNFSSTGGQTLQKPDFTAADGVYTTTPGFAPFLGTSAAAPHAAAIAALLWSYNPFLTPSAIRSILTSTALDIGTPGFDRNSGAGIVMAYQALAVAPQSLLQNVQVNDGNENGKIDPNECVDLVVTLHNPTAQTITGITAVLTSVSPEVFVDPTAHAFPDLQPSQNAVAAAPFRISTGPGYVCGSNALFLLQVKTASLGSFPQPFELASPPSGLGSTTTFASTNAPTDIPDLGTIESPIQVSGIALPLTEIRVAAYITHTYDQDLRISLVAPDDTEVVLSANNGQSGHNFGSSCSAMTQFSDDGTASIVTAAAPFVGVFTPEQPLSTFQGKSGAGVNGVWRLRVSDQAEQDTGTLQCWTLELTPIGCIDGGGQCLFPAHLTQQPSDQVVTNHNDVALTALADGTAPLSYQWYFNSSAALPQATNATLLLTNISLAQAGTYQIVVTNLYSSITSAPATLTVVVPARIVSNPENQMATNGDTVTLNVLAEGDPPLSYQWYFNVTNTLVDATNSSLVLTNVTQAQSGAYEVIVSNLYASVTSAPANLAVVVLPSIACSSDISVEQGSPWNFSPPTFDDTNLVLSVVGTATNILCGDSYGATRQWLVSATNGYQVTCSQTVQVLDTTPPVLNCPADKTNTYGDAWDFDLPQARDPGTIEALVYDNWTNNLSQKLEPGQIEVGNQIVLGGSERYASRLAFGYWGTNSSQQTFAGAVTIRVRFYLNDGQALPTGEATPGTVFYDSGPLPIGATNRGVVVLSDFELNAATPLQGALPSTFTWTVSFSGLADHDAAGLNRYGPPVVGQAAAHYWVFGPTGWTLEGPNGKSFGGQLSALSQGTTLSVLSTVTNVSCARTFTATRTWQALDSCGNAASCSQTVTVLDQSAPVIVTQPKDQSGLAGRSVSLAVNVSSCPTTSFQWYFNQTNRLAEGTNATLVLTDVTLAQSGSYQVVITNLYGSVTSAVAVVEIVLPPAIVTSPADVVATNGDTVQWTVDAQGAGSLSYQWFFNGATALEGETGATLILSNVSPAQAGEYTVVVSDTNGSTASVPARLQVLVLPTIISTQNPIAIPDVGTMESQVSIAGMNLPLGRVIVGVHIVHTYDHDLSISLLSPDGLEVVLSANNGQSGQNYGAGCDQMTVFSDSAPTSIVASAAPFVGMFEPQQPLSAFIGKNGTNLNGLWTLRVRDEAAPDTGTLQCWTLELDPMGCLALDGPCLTPPRLIQDISDQVATNGTTVHWSLSVEGADPLSYQWYFNSTNALLEGTNATLDLPDVTLAQAGIYQAVVTNIYGSVTSSPASLAVIAPATILANPTNQVATNGDTVTWTVLASGADPLVYQWYFNLTNALVGQTNSSLIFTNVSPEQAGLYDVVVSNVYASVTSVPAELVVRLIPRIICSPDITVPQDSPWSFTPPAFSDTNLNVVLLSTTTNSLCNQSYSATRQWLVSDTNGYQVTCSQTVQVLDTAPPLLSCHSDKSVALGDTWAFDLPLARDAGAIEALVYDNWTNKLDLTLDPGVVEVGNQITLDGSEQYPGRLALEYWGTNAHQNSFAGLVAAQVRFYLNDGQALPTGEATPGTVFYDSGPLAISATNRGAIVIDDFEFSAALPLHGTLPSNFTWTVAFSGLANQDAAGLNLYGPPVVGQTAPGYWALGATGWTLQGQAGQGFGGQFSALSQTATLSVVSTETNIQCGGTFTVKRTWQALGNCGNSASCSQIVTVLDQSAPLITTQPQDQSLLAGQTISLSVRVAGCSPPFYQWFFNETNALRGETNSDLVLTNAGSGQAGTYLVVITNVYGNATSAPVNVIVHVPAVIVGNPVDQVATNGDDVHWRVLAKGSAPLFYQWFFNTTNLLDLETNATLDLLAVSPAQSGTYQVVVSNVYGSVTSAPAFLAVVVPPSIVEGPLDQVVTNGDTVTWTVLAQGTDPLSYQWYFESGVLDQETNATLVLTNVLSTQAGIYDVVVANAYGSVTSAPARLSIMLVPVVCSHDQTVALGDPWDFTPPTYSDTNLLLQVLDTSTNVLCGDSYSATRIWLVSDTNDFQVTCSQTIRVLDTAAPVTACPADKSVIYGESWAFDLPTARAAGAVEATVYDNWTNSLGQSLDLAQIEAGSQITLADSERYPTRLSLEYFGTNATQEAFAGQVTARVRFYHNNGPAVAVSLPSPGTVFFDSGPLPISATNRGALVLEDFQLSAATPLQGALPASFTWTVSFSGLGDQDAAGLNLHGPGAIGQAGTRYWVLGTNGWSLQGQDGQSFGAQLSALSRGASLSVLSTVTNASCARSFTATRTWQALDDCGNAASCGQRVTVLDQSAPFVLTQPQNQLALLGQTVSLTVGVSTCPPTSYQWYFDETSALTEGTAETLVLSNLTIDRAGSYQVLITNPYGSVTSAPAVLTISGAPSILSQPQDVVSLPGGTAVFTVTAVGLPTPSYQWLFNDTNRLAGETSPSLTLTNLQNPQAGFYSVLVSNRVGTATSTEARLTLVESLTITGQPTNRTVLQGQPAVFTVTAVGVGTLSYQWLANCTQAISGATSPTLRLKSVTPADSGSYCVTVSDGFGPVQSQPAVLRVLAQPKLTSLTSTQNGVSLSFSTVPGLLYSVYSKDKLSNPTWKLLPNAFQQPGTGAPMTVNNAAATGKQGFYRIVVE